jgi:TPR repeat protein
MLRSMRVWAAFVMAGSWVAVAYADNECATPAACYENAQKYASGHGGPKRDWKKAAALATRACDQKEPRGCVLAGELIDQARLGRPDRKKSAGLYKKACEAGLGQGCASWAWALYRDEGDAGQDVVETVNKALGLFDKACEGGGADACYGAALLLDGGPGRTPDKRAMALYQKACDAGIGDSCFKMGQRLLRSTESRPEAARGVAVLKKACDAGVLAACIEAGMTLEKGAPGVIKDEAMSATLLLRALSAFEKDCDAALLDACVSLGVMYEAGQGMMRSAKTASGYYKKACDGGEASGCRKLAELFNAGEGGIERSERDSMRLWKRGCDLLDGESCERASNFFGTANPKEAARYHTRACDLDKTICQPK